MSDPVLNQPVLRKWMPICKAVGEFENGPDMTGDLSRAYLKGLIANLKKYPRQIPVYLSTGAPNPDHPEGLDERFADGWVEDLEMRGDWLYGDVKTHGQAAVAIANDLVRGASIGTAHGKSYDGDDIGPVLEHLVITNQPFVKGMNIAATRKGGEPVAYHFTALLTEATMADKKKPGDQAPEGDESVNLTEKVTALESMLQDRDSRIADLEAANANLLDENKAFRERPELTLAQKEINQLKRVNLANEVRRICGLMLQDRQINSEVLRGWADHDSHEVVLAGFKNSQFKGDLSLLHYHRATAEKKPSRSYIGAIAGGDGELTQEERKQLVAMNKDPEDFVKVRGARSFTEYKRRKAALQKGA